MQGSRRWQLNQTVASTRSEAHKGGHRKDASRIVVVLKKWTALMNRIQRRAQDGMGSHLPPGQQGALCSDIATMVGELQHMMEVTMLLFPDMNREQHKAQEFCFAAPTSQIEWLKLKAKVSCTREGYLPHVIVKEDEEEIALVLRDLSDTDDDCVATGAYLRMVLEFTGMIYALPYAQGPIGTTIASIIARTAGVPPHQVRHVEV
jgi:hypothetical protein